MSFIGQNPKSNTYRLEPLSADPTNPQEGDMFYSDGTPRDEGPWVYQNGDWAQISTGVTLSVLDKLTLTPQSVDPATLLGTLFVSDGTTRAAGLWIYTSDGWAQLSGVRYQEFFHRQPIIVRAASTANVILNNIFAGVAFGGVTLALNDLILLKNQSTASENGVYIVGVTGPVVRDVSADTVAELNRCVVYVTQGTNADTVFYQTQNLSTLLDNQTWSTAPAHWDFYVPAGVYQLGYEGCGQGGGGGSGASNTSTAFAGGGGGGGAAPWMRGTVNVTPGQYIVVQVAKFGSARAPGVSGSASGVQGPQGEVTSFFGQQLVGGGGGAGGGTNALATTASQSCIGHGLPSQPAGTSAPGGASLASSFPVNVSSVGSFGGVGGTGGQQGSGNGTAGAFVTPKQGGGGGGANRVLGAGSGNGGDAAPGVNSGNPAAPAPNAPFASYGAGGGGGGGALNGPSGAGGKGSWGYLKLFW